MKKKFFIVLMALVSCFVLASCGDEKENEPKPSAGEIVLSTTWEETANSIDIIMTEKSSIYTIKTITSYTFSGETITGMTMIEDCGTAILAKEVYAELLEDMDANENVEYSLNGSKITAVFGPSEYEELTKSEVIILAKQMEGTRTISIDGSASSSGSFGI